MRENVGKTILKNYRQKKRALVHNLTKILVVLVEQIWLWMIKISEEKPY